MKIFLASPRGFCQGVRNAVNLAEKALEDYKDSLPIYILGEIVHNKYISESLNKKGLVSVKSINEVSEGSVLIFSAHGVPPAYYLEASKKNIKIIDATCSLVKRVHQKIKKYAEEDYFIFYIGNKDHEETIGVLAECPVNQYYLINNKKDLENIKNNIDLERLKNKKITYLSQTTLNIKEIQEIIDYLKTEFNIEESENQDICYATRERQRAVEDLAKICDLVLILGSQNSSNSKRLKECAENVGCEALLIDSVNDINLKEVLKNKQNIAISAGASAPEILVEELLNKIKLI